MEQHNEEEYCWSDFTTFVKSGTGLEEPMHNIVVLSYKNGTVRAFSLSNSECGSHGRSWWEQTSTLDCRYPIFDEGLIEKAKEAISIEWREGGYFPKWKNLVKASNNSEFAGLAEDENQLTRNVG